MWGVTLFIFFFGVLILAFKLVDFSKIKTDKLNKKLKCIQEKVLHDYVMQFAIGIITTIIGVTLESVLKLRYCEQNDKMVKWGHEEA